MKLTNRAILDVLNHVRDKVEFTGSLKVIDPAAVESDCSREDIAHALYSLIKGDILHGTVSTPLERDGAAASQGVVYRVGAFTLYGQRYYDEVRGRF